MVGTTIPSTTIPKRLLWADVNWLDRNADGPLSMVWNLYSRARLQSVFWKYSNFRVWIRLLQDSVQNNSQPTFTWKQVHDADAYVVYNYHGQLNRALDPTTALAFLRVFKARAKHYRRLGPKTRITGTYYPNNAGLQSISSAACSNNLVSRDLSWTGMVGLFAEAYDTDKSKDDYYPSEFRSFLFDIKDKKTLNTAAWDQGQNLTKYQSLDHYIAIVAPFMDQLFVNNTINEYEIKLTFDYDFYSRWKMYQLNDCQVNDNECLV